MLSRAFVKWLFSVGSSHGTRRIGAFPTHIGSWTIYRRHTLIQHAQIHAELCSMMRGVEDAPPKDPYSFAFHIKERNNLKPPFLTLLRQKRQTVARELNHPRRKGLRSPTLRQDFVCRHFRQP